MEFVLKIGVDIMIKCYDFYNEVIDYRDFEKSLHEGTRLIIETERDYQALRKEVHNYDAFCQVEGKGEYRYFYVYDKFFKAYSFKEACDVLRLRKDTFYCIIENDKYYIEEE